MPEPAHKRQLISTVYTTPLMTPTTALGLSIRLSIFELRETVDWDIFLDRESKYASFFYLFFSFFPLFSPLAGLKTEKKLKTLKSDNFFEIGQL